MCMQRCRHIDRQMMHKTCAQTHTHINVFKEGFTGHWSYAIVGLVKQSVRLSSVPLMLELEACREGTEEGGTRGWGPTRMD